MSACPVQNLIQHFTDHFNFKTRDDAPKSPPPEILNPPEYITKLRKIGHYSEIDQTPPRSKEIAENLSKLKNNKAALDIATEYLKYANENLDVLRAIFCKNQAILRN